MLNTSRFLFRLRDQHLLQQLSTTESFLYKATTRNASCSTSPSPSPEIKRESPSSNAAASPSVSTNTPSAILARQIKIEEERLRVEMEKVKQAQVANANIIMKNSPKSLENYLKLMRLDKPSPILLTYWPSAWAILGAASYLNHSTPDFYLLSLFGVGAVAMRSAGCIINDIWDRKLDRQVERTKDRPLASGKVGLPGALALLTGNLSLALAVLMQLDVTTQILGACALFPVAVYPAAKRFTNWPQAVLGVAFNWGAMMGWSAMLCQSPAALQTASLLSFAPAFVLYGACINWTLFYDTIYAYQDKIYDEKAGFKSTAIILQKRTSLWMLGFSTACVSNLALFGYLTSQEPIFYISLGVAMAHFIKQIAFVNYKSPESCYRQFKSNSTLGAIVAFGLLASILIK